MMLILAALLAWCSLSLPLAVLVGRSLADRDEALDRPGRPEFDLAA